MSSLARHRVVAVLALAGLFVSVYLLLYNLGYYGLIQCGTGSCEVVQSSKWATLLGVPVSGWGAAWYAAMFALALVVAARPEPPRLVRPLIAAGATAGLAFSAYLTAIEAFVLEAWCRWCVVSAVLAVGIFVFVAPWRTIVRRETARTR